MATNNLSQVNSFVKGIDSDSALLNVESSNYIDAENVRFITYSSSNGDANNEQGVLKPINGITQVYKKKENIYRILATGCCRNYGVIVWVTNDGKLTIKRFFNKIGGDKDTIDTNIKDIDLITVFQGYITSSWGSNKSKWPEKLSITFRYEDTDNIKLYLADGYNPIAVFNISEEADIDYSKSTIYDVSTYPKCIFHKPEFVKYVNGSLKPAMVSYAYRLYSLNSIATDVSPACQPIPVVNFKDGNKDNIQQVFGEEMGSETNCGIQIRIPIDIGNSIIDQIQIYRITTVQQGQVPTIELIYDNSFSESTNGYFYLTDVGQEAIDTISLEEYNSFQGLHIIPTVIESKDDYLFAANIQDKSTFIDYDEFLNWDSRTYRCNINGEYQLTNTSTQSSQTFPAGTDTSSWYHSEEPLKSEAYNVFNDINTKWADKKDWYVYTAEHNGKRYWGGTGVNIEWRFIVTDVILDSCDASNNRDIGTRWNIIKQEQVYKDPKTYFITSTGLLEDSPIGISNEVGKRDNPWLTKSLRRNELYRYGIVLYDKTGCASPVKWIADIRTPNLYDTQFNTFMSQFTYNGKKFDLSSRPLGIAFKVHVPNECTAYEIVRCPRSYSDIATISQGIISKPIINYSTPSQIRSNSAKYFPTGWMSTILAIQGSALTPFHRDFDVHTNNSLQDIGRQYSTNIQNTELLQFVSAETTYLPDTFKAMSNNKDFTLEPLRYIFGSRGDKGYQPDLYDKDDGNFVTDKGDDWKTKLSFLQPATSNLNIRLLSPNVTTHTRKKRLQANGRFISYFYIDEENDVAVRRFDSTAFVAVNQSSHTRTPLYYKADPQFTLYGSPAAQISVKGDSEYPYSCINVGTDRGSNTERKTSTVTYKIDNIVYAFVKLYEQANDVYCREYKQNDAFYSGDNTCHSVTIGNSSKQLKINDITMASELKWNEVIKVTFEEKGSNSQTKDNGRWWPQLEYDKHVDNVGSIMYCNAVFNGMDGIRIDNGGSIGNDKFTIAKDLIDVANENSEGSVADYGDSVMGGTGDTEGRSGSCYHVGAFVFGAGGRCALLNVDSSTADEISGSYVYNQILNTLGAQSVLKADKNNILQNWFGDIYSGATTTDDINAIVIRNSIFGTTLCNMRKATTPYGGYHKQAINSSVYTSNGMYFVGKELDAWNPVFDGDCVIQVLDYTAMHKTPISIIKDTDDSKVVDVNKYRAPSMMIQYAIPLECSVWVQMEYGFAFSKNSSTNGVTCIQIEPSEVNQMYSQTKPEYVYNTAYSAENKTRLFAALDEDNVDDYNHVVDYRCYYSNRKDNDERIDSWTKFQSSNFLDVKSEHGPINHVRNFKQWLVFWQQKATGWFSVNERALANTINGTEVQLGVGGVMARYDYMDETTGMHTRHFADVQTATTLYWYDAHNREIRSFGGQGAEPLSKATKTQNMLYSHEDKDIIPWLFYNKYNNEVVFECLKDKQSLALHSTLGVFTSRYTIPFDGAIEFDNGNYLIYAGTDGYLRVGQWGVENEYSTTWDNAALRTYLSYVVNEQPLETKVFDNQEIIMPYMLQPVGKRNDIDSYFSKNHLYTWRTETMATDSNLEDQMTLRENNYRYAIPRAYDELYGNRMRGKYLVCSIFDIKPRTNAGIQHIFTKFRISWS